MVIQNCSARPMGSSNFSLTKGNWDCQTRVSLESLVSQCYLNLDACIYSNVEPTSALAFSLFTFLNVGIWCDVTDVHH